MSRPGVPGWMRLGIDSMTIEVRARPGASRRAIVGADERGLTVALHARATEGRANAELVEIVARAASLPPSAVTIERGGRSRSKLLRLMTANPVAVAARLTAQLIGSAGETTANNQSPR